MPLPAEIMPGVGQKPAGAFKPSIHVVVDGHYSSKVYTSGSTISGHAQVKCTKDVSFDGFEIVFLGIAQTRLDFVQQFPTSSRRVFMKLRMPIPEAHLPASRVFEANETYIVPFNFVVPHQLTISACNHHTAPAVQEQHLRLPPTVGHWEVDDQAPDMAKVEYSIKARATRKVGPGQSEKLMEGSHMVKVLGDMPEDAPISLSRQDERYTTEKHRTTRKGMFGKAGKLTVSGEQPNAVMLSADGRQAGESKAVINLEFEPASADAPKPKITSASGKLTAVTFFSAGPKDTLPNLGPRANYCTNPSLNYSTTTALFSAPVGEVPWKQEHLSPSRRDSGYSSIGVAEASSDEESDGRGRRGSKDKGSSKKGPPIKYTGKLKVPFSVPITSKKFFLPTFHSCLISRTYTLQLSVSLGTGPTSTSLTLSVPLQVGVDRVFEPPGAELPSFESAMAQAAEEEADEALRPRLMSRPAPELQGDSALPGYGEVTGHGRMVAVA